MPIASVSIAVNVKPGERNSERDSWRNGVSSATLRIASRSIGP